LSSAARARLKVKASATSAHVAKRQNNNAIIASSSSTRSFGIFASPPAKRRARCRGSRSPTTAGALMAAAAEAGFSALPDLLGWQSLSPKEIGIMLDVSKPQAAAPFDTARLDRLMDEAGIDVLMASSTPWTRWA
jgi:hypothetical protein